MPYCCVHVYTCSYMYRHVRVCMVLQARLSTLISSFSGIKQLGVHCTCNSTPPWMGYWSITGLPTWEERGTVRVKYLTQEQGYH